KRRTFAAPCHVLRSSRFFRATCAPRAGIQPNPFKFFAIHLSFPHPITSNQNRYTNLPPKLSAAHRAATPAAPSAARALCADATESSQSGTRSSSPLPRNSALPTRIARLPHEIPQANSSPRLLQVRLAACVPPRKPVSACPLALSVFQNRLAVPVAALVVR